MINTNNTLRVTGLASGMNTDEIVANLVKAQSSRLNKMQQSKTLATWKSDAYRDVNKKFDVFRKAMEGLRLQSTFTKQTVSSSNESMVYATVSGTPTKSSYEITNVQQATPATATSVKFFQTTRLDTTKKLSELSATDDNGDGKISLTVNGKDIVFTGDETLSAVLDKIKSESSLSVSYSVTDSSLTFTNDSTGTGEISITGDATVLNALGITTGSTNATDPSNASYKNASNMSVVYGSNATQAKMWIDGLEFRSNTNTITYDGMTFDIKSSMLNSADKISITTKSDTDSIVTNIKTFVDKYNEIIADLNGGLTEKRYRDYPPLLDDQKKDMKENDIKLWEEKAKSGLLTGDSTIRTALTEMRNSLSEIVRNSGAFKSLKDIGINFSSSYQDHGKLILDETKLKGVLETNLNDVKSLFTTKGTGTNSSSTTVTDSTMHENSGVGWRIYDRLNVTITQLGALVGSSGSLVDTTSSIAKIIKSLDTNINNEQEKITAYEQRLWKQFGAMEKALSQLNAQSSWLSQQLGN